MMKSALLRRVKGLFQPEKSLSPDETSETIHTTTVAPESSTTIPAQVLERYDDSGEVGRGGMARVHRVFDRTLLREVALKILRPEFAGKERLVQRFIREAQITAQLDHPNIVPIHELGQDPETGAFYENLKLVRGETLTEALKNAGSERLNSENLVEFLQIFLKVCDAVAFAHNRGVIHRDLKPSNIMVGEFGQVYVMDWGVARLLDAPTGEGAQGQRVCVAEELENALSEEPGNIIGTPRYMPPEQVRGQHDQIDQRADIFALGAILYHILTGRPPYAAKSYYKTLLEAQSAQIIPPEQTSGGSRIPSGLAAIAMQALAPQPQDRYESVSDLKRDLERFLRGSWDQVTKTFAAGMRIITEGEEGLDAYIIVSGRCLVFTEEDGRRRILREMGPGEVFAETALFSSTPRTASVEAIDEVTVKVVSRETLTHGLGLNSWMGVFVKALADRFRDVDEKLRKAQTDLDGEAGAEPDDPAAD